MALENRQIVQKLLASRVTDHKRLNPAIYNHFPMIIKDFSTQRKFQAPELIVTYSPKRNAELITVRDEPFLIYDQYLGQTFNHLNTVSQTPSKESVLKVYSYKILAEEFRLRGDKNKAVFFGLKYGLLASWARQKLLPAMQNARYKRSTYTHIQEVYVLCHELAHRSLLFDVHALKVGKAENRAYIRNSFIGRKLNEIKTFFDDLPLETREKYTSSEREAYSNFKQEINQICHWLGMSFEISEQDLDTCAIEMICDNIALIVSSGFYLNVLGLTNDVIMEGVWLGQLYLWYLRTLQNIGKCFANIDVSASDEGRLLYRHASIFTTTNHSSNILFRLRNKKVENDSYEICDMYNMLGLKAHTFDPRSLHDNYHLLIDTQYGPFLDTVLDVEKEVFEPFTEERIESMLNRVRFSSEVDIRRFLNADWRQFVDWLTGWINNDSVVQKYGV